MYNERSDQEGSIHLPIVSGLNGLQGVPKKQHRDWYSGTPKQLYITKTIFKQSNLYLILFLSYRVSQKTCEFSDEFDIVFVMN